MIAMSQAQMDAIDAKMRVQRERLFAAWMQRAEIKLMISLLPPLVTDTQREGFNVLLRSAFESGHLAGCGAVAGAVFENFLRRGEAKKPD